jgi:2-aminoadipate transaminase
LKENLPSGCTFETPKGGLTIWVKLPKEINSLPLLSLARDVGVQFVPAAFLMPDRKDAPAFRLSFSRNNPDVIEAGIRKLCGVIGNCIRNPELLEKGAKSYEDLYK